MNKFTVAHYTQAKGESERASENEWKYFLFGVDLKWTEQNRAHTHKKIVETFVPISRYGIRVKTSKA